MGESKAPTISSASAGPRNATTPEAMHKVKGIIDMMIAEGKVDPNRIYITGFSMGGGSTWTFLTTYPDVPAAAAPLCPAGGPGSVENALKVAYLPIWTFVDEGDFLLDGRQQRQDLWTVSERLFVDHIAGKPAEQSSL